MNIKMFTKLILQLKSDRSSFTVLMIGFSSDWDRTPTDFETIFLFDFCVHCSHHKILLKYQFSEHFNVHLFSDKISFCHFVYFLLSPLFRFGFYNISKECKKNHSIWYVFCNISEKIQCSLSRQHINIQLLFNWFLLHFIYDYRVVYLTENCGCTCKIICYLYCNS
jgi:hypothetical protein